MKKLTTIICCVAMALFGFSVSPITTTNQTVSLTQTVSAGTMPSLQYGTNIHTLGTPCSDTIRIHDTIRVSSAPIPKYIKSPTVVKRDTLYVPLIFIARPNDGEEHPLANLELDRDISELVKVHAVAD